MLHFSTITSLIAGRWVDIFGRKKCHSRVNSFSFSEFLFGVGNQIMGIILLEQREGLVLHVMMPESLLLLADTTSVRKTEQSIRVFISSLLVQES